MPFDNPVVAGDTLVRTAIQSPNFVTTVTGWIVRADGTAEFSNMVLRGDFTVTGLNGRTIRAYFDTTSNIPVIDFKPPNPSTPGWTVAAGSIYEYTSAGAYEILGISSPQQNQPGGTGEALIELRSGKSADPTTAVMLTTDAVVVYGTGGTSGSLLHGPEFLPYLFGQRGVQLVTATGTANIVIPIAFLTPFPAGTVPTVLTNINSQGAGTPYCRVRAINITASTFALYVESADSGSLLNWTNIPVGWLAVAER